MASVASPTADTGDDLVALLGPELAASRRVAALTLCLREGPWDTGRIPQNRRSAFGVAMLSGVVARELHVAGYEATELLGEGDVIDPWTGQAPEAFLPTSVEWSVLTPARVLVIDEGLAGAAGARSPLLRRLHASASRRASRLAVSQAIAQLPRIELRLLALFWHLAGRWGRVGREGILLQLPLSHALLGRLVGARRPTVTLALGELGERGYVRRRDDGAWQLGSAAPDSLGAESDHPVRQRRPRPEREPDQLDRMAQHLAANLAAARARLEERAEALPDQLARLAELRRHTAEVRERSARLREDLARQRREAALDGGGRDGAGRDGAGRDGDGRDGDGRDGDGRDGNGRDGASEAAGRDGNGSA